MKTFTRVGAQGDLLLIRVADDAVPKTSFVKSNPTVDGKHIVAHSETGHHHTVAVLDDDVDFYVDPKDDLRSFLVVKDILGKVLTHERSFDTHEALWLPKGTYELRRQEEYTPQGWRKVQD